MQLYYRTYQTNGRIVTAIASSSSYLTLDLRNNNVELKVASYLPERGATDVLILTHYERFSDDGVWRMIKVSHRKKRSDN